MNSVHYDIFGVTCFITTWTEKKIGSANGWYFVMPNTTRDGSKGIAVALSYSLQLVGMLIKYFIVLQLRKMV